MLLMQKYCGSRRIANDAGAACRGLAMLSHFVSHALPLLGAAIAPAYRSVSDTRYATLEYYNPARDRTRTATFVLNLFAAAVSSVVLTKGVDREELFERYDVKLWSFNDHVALFALATAPSVAALAVLYAAFRGVQGIRSVLSL